MKKLFEFLKTKKLVIQWTIGYFTVLWFILKFLFKFDMFSAHYWHRFFHASFHGFPGFVFCVLVYSAIPIYIASVLVINRTQTPLITIPLLNKVYDFIVKLFPKKEIEPVVEAEPEPEQPKEEKKDEYPNDMPPELHIPFQRIKNNIALREKISVYNKPVATTPVPETTSVDNFSDILPPDFDIPETTPQPSDEFVPTFTDINFDEPEQTLENNTTKYFTEKNIEFETYKEFVATEKYLIYEHNDKDFWIMDEDIWFASGKQIDSPIPELKQIASDNGLTPILYLHTQNIMDAENTIKNFESNGVHVITNLNELK